MRVVVDWPRAIRPLVNKYKHQKHPLNYHNHYQLLVMVVLSAQSTDLLINSIAPDLFREIPDMETLAAAKSSKLLRLIKKVRNARNKCNWLLQIAEITKDRADIPLSMDELVALPGIGRKSASVILREAGRPPEGVIVDLHVVRVAPRLSIAQGADPKKIEQQLMEVLPRKLWEAGMSMSFLGREICRPKPKCELCLMRKYCAYYLKTGNKLK